MHISRLKDPDDLEAVSADVWIDPRDFEGVDAETARQSNDRHLNGDWNADDEDTDDGYIADYIGSYVRKHRRPHALDRYLGAVCFLINAYHSVPAAVRLASLSRIVTDKDVQHCADTIMACYQTADPLAQKAFRLFIPDFFRYEENQYEFEDALSPESLAFLNEVYHNQP